MPLSRSNILIVEDQAITPSTSKARLKRRTGK